MHVAFSMSDVIKTFNGSEVWVNKVSCILHADRIFEIMLEDSAKWQNAGPSASSCKTAEL